MRRTRASRVKAPIGDENGEVQGKKVWQWQGDEGQWEPYPPSHTHPESVTGDGETECQAEGSVPVKEEQEVGPAEKKMRSGQGKSQAANTKEEEQEAGPAVKKRRGQGQSQGANTKEESQASRKQLLDQAILNFILKDCQPLSVVENEGFRELLQVLEPSYVLPTRKTVKEMVAKRYEDELKRVKLEVQQAVAVSITADMWTSVNMEAYLALTCHYINENMQLCTSVLGVQYFPQNHTADNLAQVERGMMEDWAITNKVKCLVTDAAPNMIASTRQLQIQHSICIAHSLNLIVRKSCDQVPTLTSIRHKARNIVTYFRSSTTAKEKLAQVQQQMGRPTRKLINEVATRWNSTYEMLARLRDEKEPVWVALASLKSDITPLTADEFTIIGEALLVLAPFHQATVELSEEKRVSGSKVIPMMKMLYHSLECNASNLHTQTATQLHEHLKRRVTDTASSLESLSVLTLSTLLDPRYKSLGFCSSSKCTEAINRLKSECAAVIGRTSVEPQPGPSTQQLSATTSDLWRHLDEEVGRQTTNSTADAIIEVQRYLAESNAARSQDPLKYWDSQRNLYPNLLRLSLQYLCTPASSVPCERVFSKAGELASKKRNRLNAKTLEHLIFLNKNL